MRSTIPVERAAGGSGGAWSRGLGDVELALRRTFYASSTAAASSPPAAPSTLPTGKEDRGLGNGFTVVEPFAMWGQMVGTNGFLQLHAGYEVPIGSRAWPATKVSCAPRSATPSRRIEGSAAPGRRWRKCSSPSPRASAAEWDVVPQMQVSLSKLQHVLLSVGVRVPLNERDERKPRC